MQASLGMAECLIADGKLERAERVLWKLYQEAGEGADLGRLTFDLAGVLAREGKKIQAVRMYRLIAVRMPNSPLAAEAEREARELLPTKK
jgi:TolA-binding protein